MTTRPPGRTSRWWPSWRRELDVPVLAEGRYGTQEEVWAALGAGAFAVVVGTAITDPEALTRRLASAPPLGADG